MRRNSRADEGLASPRSGRARWPDRSSKPVRSCSPRLGRFDSCAAPLSRNPLRYAGFGVSEAPLVVLLETAGNRRGLARTGAKLARGGSPFDAPKPEARHLLAEVDDPLPLPLMRVGQ